MQLKEQLLHKINTKTKPVGALGMLEGVALQIGLIQNTLSPQISKPHIVVFAADHGIAATGKVNPYPQSVTAQMVLNFVNGGAAINVFCKQNRIDLTVVDAGVNFDFDEALPVVHAKIRKGTNDYSLQQAMTIEETNAAIEKGAAIVQQIFNSGCNTIGFGEMGIGNTSSASLIMHHYTGLNVSECVGRGTGATDELLQQKVKVLEQSATLHQLSNNISAIELLSKAGGFEIAMMAGAYVKAAELNMITIVDGFIATAALMIAKELNEKVMSNCIFAHCSDENGHRKMLDYLQAKPLLNIGMRLGEGTGAALAIPIIESAVNFLNEMASFESAGVSNKN
jgi:nicotinate-nucleotide--dimethylbenzimidazole phosphoribosyltransferase